MQAKDIMKKEVVTVSPDTPVKEIAKLLHDHNISGMPVTDKENKVIGIVSETDLIAKVSRPHLPAHIQLLGGIIYLESPHKMDEELKKMTALTAQQIMTKNVIKVTPETSVEEIASLMMERDVNRVPVTEDDKLVGIITRHDLVATMLQS